MLRSLKSSFFLSLCSNVIRRAFARYPELTKSAKAKIIKKTMTVLAICSHAIKNVKPLNSTEKRKAVRKSKACDSKSPSNKPTTSENAPTKNVSANVIFSSVVLRIPSNKYKANSLLRRLIRKRLAYTTRKAKITVTKTETPLISSPTNSIMVL